MPLVVVLSSDSNNLQAVVTDSAENRLVAWQFSVATSVSPSETLSFRALMNIDA